MRPLVWISIVVLLLGIIAFIVPVPTSHSHSVKLGDASLGVTTHSNEKLSPLESGACFAPPDGAVGSGITQIDGLSSFLMVHCCRTAGT